MADLRSLDVHFDLGGLRFVWNAQKAVDNYAKHGIRFERACEVFLDPLCRIVDASVQDEAREALVGESNDGRVFCSACSARRRRDSHRFRETSFARRRS